MPYFCSLFQCYRVLLQNNVPALRNNVQFLGNNEKKPDENMNWNYWKLELWRYGWDKSVSHERRGVSEGWWECFWGVKNTLTELLKWSRIVETDCATFMDDVLWNGRGVKTRLTQVVLKTSLRGRISTLSENITVGQMSNSKCEVQTKSLSDGFLYHVSWKDMVDEKETMSSGFIGKVSMVLNITLWKRNVTFQRWSEHHT